MREKNQQKYAVIHYRLGDKRAVFTTHHDFNSDKIIDPISYKKIIDAIENTVTKTANNSRGTINICFNYGGQSEIADAFKNLSVKRTDSEEITPELIRENLYHPELPPVDYIVRTSGEKRLSNFLLWDSAYAELEFVDEHWPAFTKESLDGVLSEYASRIRRFGK